MKDKKMKRCLWILLLVALCASICAATYRIYRAGTNDLVDVVENNAVYYPFSTVEIYTIEGKYIYKAGTRDWIYTIEGGRIYRAGTRDWIYTIEKAD